MLVKHITKNEFDVFFNKGWENWARYELQNGKLVQTKGVQVPDNIKTFLDKRYCGGK